MTMTRHALRRALTALGLATGLAAGLLATAPAASAAAVPAAAARERGFDVSYPQCGAVLPGGADFAVVGVDGGRPFDPNPCLAEQIAWARTAGRPQYYLNTANPGPRQPLIREQHSRDAGCCRCCWQRSWPSRSRWR